jgi:hypothetical protein
MNAASTFRSRYFKVQHYMKDARGGGVAQSGELAVRTSSLPVPPDGCDSILRQMHGELLAEWLKFSLQQQEEDIRVWAARTALTMPGFR